MEILFAWTVVILLFIILLVNESRKKKIQLIEYQLIMARKYEDLYLQWMREYHMLKNSDAIKEEYELNLSFETFGNSKAIRKEPKP